MSLLFHFLLSYFQGLFFRYSSLKAKRKNHFPTTLTMILCQKCSPTKNENKAKNDEIVWWIILECYHFLCMWFKFVMNHAICKACIPFMPQICHTIYHFLNSMYKFNEICNNSYSFWTIIKFNKICNNCYSFRFIISESFAKIILFQKNWLISLFNTILITFF